MTHRLHLAQYIRRAGWDVHLATQATIELPSVESARASGIPVHHVPIARQGINPLQDVLACIALVSLYRRIQPDIVHHVTIKPVLYGSLAARLTKIPGVVNAISGLGRLFRSETLASRLRALLVAKAYRFLVQHPHTRAIFQNEEDRATFLRYRIVKPTQTVLIPGSGTLVNDFHPKVKPEEPPIVLMPARILRQKGAREFAEAARRLRADGVPARFAIAGDTAGNRDAIPERELTIWRTEYGIELWGWVDDMAMAMSRAAIVCLPSYHEGTPKSLIDACAAGRAIVASDIAGCRTVVQNGVNGLLVPVKDVDSLTQALRTLIADSTLRERMGIEARKIAEKKLDLRKVAELTLQVYADLRP